MVEYRFPIRFTPSKESIVKAEAELYPVDLGRVYTDEERAALVERAWQIEKGAYN